jgi:hypothetical protein
LIAVDPQLTIYHRAAQELLGEDVVLGLHWLPGEIIEPKKNIVQPPTIYWTTRGKYAMNEVAIMLLEGKSRVDQQKFERNISYACKWCPFKEDCLGKLVEEEQ